MSSKEKRPAVVEAVERFWTQARGQAEARVEEAARKTITRLKVPRREEVAQLAQRLDALSKRIEALTK